MVHLGPSEWTDERIARLRQLHADRLSTAQIAVQMNREYGAELSRNAIIGKLHRLGIIGGDKKIVRVRPRKPRAQTMDSVSAIRRAQDDAPLLTNVEPYVEPEEIEIPVEQRKTLLQLTALTCRWPVGDPATADFYFCGGLTDGEAVYCAYHCRISYQPHASHRHLTDEERQRRSLAARRRIATNGPTFPSARQTQEHRNGTEAEDA